MSQRIRISRPSPAMVIACTALMVALGGGAYAASQIDTRDIAPRAVTGSKIAGETIKGSKLRNNTVTGNQINEGEIGEVPAAAFAGIATQATTATNLAGQQTFYVQLQKGGTQEIATNGTVSLTALCDTGAGGVDRVRIVAATTENGAVLEGFDDFTGTGGAFLEPSTPADNREFVVNTNAAAGDVDVANDIDEGFVLGPDNKALSANSEGIILGLNYGGADCLVGGVVNQLG